MKKKILDKLANINKHKRLFLLIVGLLLIGLSVLILIDFLGNPIRENGFLNILMFIAGFSSGSASIIVSITGF